MQRDDDEARRADDCVRGLETSVTNDKKRGRQRRGQRQTAGIKTERKECGHGVRHGTEEAQTCLSRTGRASQRKRKKKPLVHTHTHIHFASFPQRLLVLLDVVSGKSNAPSNVVLFLVWGDPCISSCVFVTYSCHLDKVNVYLLGIGAKGPAGPPPLIVSTPPVSPRSLACMR